MELVQRGVQPPVDQLVGPPLVPKRLARQPSGDAGYAHFHKLAMPVHHQA